MIKIQEVLDFHNELVERYDLPDGEIRGNTIHWSLSSNHASIRYCYNKNKVYCAYGFTGIKAREDDRIAIDNDINKAYLVRLIKVIMGKI